jgi:apoptosis-inducing factor 3
MLRREGYDGSLTMISADDAPPYDRPNLSKDYLAGTASEEWLPLRAADYYKDRQIKLVLGSRVASLDVYERKLQTENGEAFGFEALLLATGADPVRLKIDGTTDSQIHYLRTYADTKAIVAKAASAKRVVVVGASFMWHKAA